MHHNSFDSSMDTTACSEVCGVPSYYSFVPLAEYMSSKEKKSALSKK